MNWDAIGLQSRTVITMIVQLLSMAAGTAGFVMTEDDQQVLIVSITGVVAAVCSLLGWYYRIKPRWKS